jgi:hypothetical protein
MGRSHDLRLTDESVRRLNQQRPLGRQRWRCVSSLASLAIIGVLLAASSLTQVQARGVSPGTFSYKLHDTVPLLEVAGSSAEFERVVDPSALFAAPLKAQAGAHPDMSLTSVLNVSGIEAVLNGEDVPSNVVFELPPGAMLNLGTVPECKLGDFERLLYNNSGPRCSPASQVGVVSALFGGVLADRTYPLYKIYAFGQLAALAFPYELRSTRVGIVISVNLRTDRADGITLSYFTAIGSDGTPSSVFVPAPFITFWGIPGDAIHDPERWNPITQEWGASIEGPHPAFVTSPSACSSGLLEARLWLRYWFGPSTGWLPEDPENPAYRSFAPEPTGCEKLTLEPEVDLSPSTTVSDSSSGITLQVKFARNQGSGLESPPIKEAEFTFPEGMSINPATVNGLKSCTPEEAGVDEREAEPGKPDALRFEAEEADCPDASKIGTAIATTPLVEKPIKGTIYLATPFKNPLHSQLALYLIFEAPGFVAEVTAKVDANPQSGQLTVTIGSLPQLPLGSLSLRLFDGPRAPISTPPFCGEASVTARFVPWSAPGSGPPTSIQGPVRFDSAPGGRPCPQRSTSRPFDPTLLAGSQDPVGAASSPFILRVARHDGEQELKSVVARLPRGLSASLQDGVSYCRDAEISQAEGRNEPGGGLLERSNPSCPVDSRVGSVLIGAGTGSIPLYSKGFLYLAGPYKGASFSLVAIVPVIAGGTDTDPLFDLGTIVVRVSLEVDPRTAQISAVSAAIPRMLDGIPLRIGDIRVLIDRSGFLRNPSSCEEMRISAEITGWEGGRANPVNRFQVGDCQQLGFKPRLNLRLVGGRAGQHPQLRATLKARAGDAGMSRSRITLPRLESLDRTRLRTTCPESVLAEHRCTGDSIYGHAVVWSPLVSQPLEGPVHLIPEAHGLPSVVLSFEGQPSIEVVGRLRLRHHRVQITFSGLPDVPFSKLLVTLRGRGKGVLVNSRELCSGHVRAAGRFTGRNGRVKTRRVILQGGCGSHMQSRKMANAR